MLPTSASCRHAEAGAPRCRPRRPGQGFTLLELLVVLALVAMVSSVVVPRAWQAINGARERAVLDELRGRLDGLAARAFLAGRAIPVAADSGTWGIPEGWRLEVTPAGLRFEANGMTFGGRVRVWADDHLVADWLIDRGAGELRNADRSQARATPT